MGYALGVDLGTAYTCAVVARDGRTDVVQLGGTSNLIPSVVSLRADGTILTGEAAERRAVTDPSRTVREFKRRFGDEAPYVIGGVPYGADALVGHLLAAVLAAVTTVEGEAPSRVALTHPADYGPFKLDLLRHAAHNAGVDDPLLVPEPVAAAIAYVERASVATGEHLAVYDLGGGTFDAAVVRVDPEGPVVVGAPEGLARLGGIDFDQAVIAHVEQATGGAVTALDSTDAEARSALSRLRSDCRAAKEALSDDTETEIPVLLPQVRTSVRLTREELESMVGPRLTDTAHVLGRVVISAGITMADISTVLLVGGSSRMPAVAQLVREHTGRPVAVDANPKTTIAAGAAVLAARAAGDVVAPTAPTPVAVPPPPIEPTTTTETPVPPAVAVAAAPAWTPPLPPPSAPAPAGGGRSRIPLLVGLAVAVVLAVLAVVLLGGGDDGGDDDVATDPTDVSTDSTEDTSTTAASVEANPGEVVLAESPGSITFGDALWAITGATVQEDGAVAVAVALENQLELADLFIDPATELVARFENGEELRSTELAGDALIPAAGSLETAFLFRDFSDASNFEGAEYAVEAAEQEPAIFTLEDFGGPPTDDAFTAQVQVPDAGGLAWDLGFLRAGLDALADHPLTGGYGTSQRRAGDGFAWLALDASAFAGDQEVVIGDSGVFLLVDGEPIFPWTGFSEALSPGGEFFVELGFLVPADAQSFELQIGAADNAEAAPPVTIDARPLLDQLPG